MKSKQIRNLTAGLLVVILAVAGFNSILNSGDVVQDDNLQAQLDANKQLPAGAQGNSQLNRVFPELDQATSLVNIDKILQGTPDKDNIPAISEPKFVNPTFSEAKDETLGILVEVGDTKRFYPYDILVNHEIVNDSIGDRHFAVTYCPLCGSAIVFDRTVDGEVIEFGVSGFLFESNMLMYDRTDSPSLWSQARAESVIGDQAGSTLTFLPLQLLSFGELKNAHPEAEVLSRETGFVRDYDREVYTGYEQDPSTIFPISVNDQRYPAKEIFYVLPTDEGSIAIQIRELEKGASATSEDLGLTISKSDDSELTVLASDGTEVFGYYEMWFSWAQHHQDTGRVFAI